jgi:hypothetical protein
MSASHFINVWLSLEEEQKDHFFKRVENVMRSDDIRVNRVEHDFETLLYVLKSCGNDKEKLLQECDLFISNNFVYDEALSFIKF